MKQKQQDAENRIRENQREYDRKERELHAELEKARLQVKDSELSMARQKEEILREQEQSQIQVQEGEERLRREQELTRLTRIEVELKMARQREESILEQEHKKIQVQESEDQLKRQKELTRLAGIEAEEKALIAREHRRRLLVREEEERLRKHQELVRLAGIEAEGKAESDRKKDSPHSTIISEEGGPKRSWEQHRPGCPHLIIEEWFCGNRLLFGGIRISMEELITGNRPQAIVQAVDMIALMRKRLAQSPGIGAITGPGERILEVGEKALHLLVPRPVRRREGPDTPDVGRGLGVAGVLVVWGRAPTGKILSWQIMTEKYRGGHMRCN